MTQLGFCRRSIEITLKFAELIGAQSTTLLDHGFEWNTCIAHGSTHLLNDLLIRAPPHVFERQRYDGVLPHVLEHIVARRHDLEAFEIMAIVDGIPFVVEGIFEKRL